MKSTAELLTEPDRKWRKSPPASDDEIHWFLDHTRFEWPEEFLDLLRFSNGGAGEISLKPQWFVLSSISEIIDSEKDEFLTENYGGFQFFGGNGGLESIAFDLSKLMKPIVMIDLIAGDDSAIEIASDIKEFIRAIGFEYKEDA